MPTTSPGNASSASWRSCAKKNCGAVQCDELAGAHQLGLHAARELAGAHPHEGDAIAVVLVHVRLNLEHEAGHLGLVRVDRAVLRLEPLRRRREGGKGIDQVANAEVAQCRAEEHRRQVAFEKGRAIELLQAVGGQLDLLDGVDEILRLHQPLDVGVARPRHLDRLGIMVEAAHQLLFEVVGAHEPPALPQRPGDRRHVERQRLLDLVQEIERVARLSVELVDEGDDRDVAQPAHLEELARARLDAARGVQHHDRGVDRRQRAVGVLRKVLVARRVEQVVDAVAVLEGHHRGDDGDAALLLDAHPVRPRLPPVGLRAHLARELDGAAEQQQLLGQRRLAGIGMRDDGEGPPPGDGVDGRRPGRRGRVGKRRGGHGPVVARSVGVVNVRVGRRRAVQCASMLGRSRCC